MGLQRLGKFLFVPKSKVDFPFQAPLVGLALPAILYRAALFRETVNICRFAACACAVGGCRCLVPSYEPNVGVGEATEPEVKNEGLAGRK